MMEDLAWFCPSLGFIGGGNMATAILRGTVGRNRIPASSVVLCDVDKSKVRALVDELRIKVAPDAAGVADCSLTLVLAVKPQNLLQVLDSMRDRIRPDHCLISIAAGVTIASIAARVPEGTRVVRVMPNTPALVGMGAAGIAAGPHATTHDLQAALALFSAVGVALPVPEKDLDAVTALSGSGPAYVFRVMEIMMRCGAEMGLEPDVARRLTLQTVAGAAQLALQSEDDPAVLRQRVTSPGGTTAAALAVFEEKGLADVLRAGMMRAMDRSIELSRG